VGGGQAQVADADAASARLEGRHETSLVTTPVSQVSASTSG
jgi:hypothetical protein